ARGCVADTSRPEPQIPEPHMKVSALAGGTGAAKLLRGLASCLAPEDLTVIGNTGDDTEVSGLHVSPDLDSVMYALAGGLARERARVKVLDVLYEGAEQARPAPRVLAAIADAELIIVCPSNPITSIGPILAVPGIREALARARARVVAVSPIVGDAAVSGPAG